MYLVYIIECSDTSLYTGVTNNLERRFDAHKSGKGGRYTRSRQVVRLVYTERHPDRSSALKREAQIKSWPRKKKLDLIQRVVGKYADREYDARMAKRKSVDIRRSKSRSHKTKKRLAAKAAMIAARPKSHR